ncbi:MAG: 1-acyl-sn-glycerol-3-phosphate acyltransferase [Treponema sp.]|nr:1-acyl-sn-glycerol-3-phosphate acyltransferase [Treponema sp.]
MIKTILAFTYVIISMIFLVPFGSVAMLIKFLGLRRLSSQIIFWIAKGWALSVIKVTGCKTTVVGIENVPKKGGVCFISNHGSYFDIALLLAYCSRQIGFIAKKELGWIPFLNCWIYMVGGLFIDRSTVRKAFNTINKGVKMIKSGGCMIIFPEGHRSKGQGLLPFHAGSLKLATMAHAPIIPVAIDGSGDVFEKTNRVVAVPIKITFCEPIDTADIPSSDKKTILSDRIYKVISEQLQKTG